jgi:hypothetical protein
MLGSKLAVLCLLFSSATIASLNRDFEHILHGKVQINQADIDRMYSAYLEEYGHNQGTAPSQIFNTNADRKAIFAQTLQEIVAHN